jgi:dimeric dUTPase (all-alpha-NTP-PPase superfamily)
MKNGEVLKKKRQQEGKVMKDSELRMIETMLKKQDELNSAIMKEFGLTTISKEQIDLATLDEIGEFTHELKGDWCWWKKSQAPVDEEKALGELVDIWHSIVVKRS